MKIAVAISGLETETLRFYQQIGVRHAILMSSGQAQVSTRSGGKIIGFAPLMHIKSRLEAFGLALEAIENFPEGLWHNVRVPGDDAAREKELADFHESMRNMARVGIPILGINWMPDGVWGHWRHGQAGGGRGGAGLVSFDYDKVKNAPPHPDGPISTEEKWNRLEYFLDRTIPVAEETGVKLALHPDDPPAPVLAGIARILNSVEGLQRVIDAFPSDCFGLDFCQGTISEFPGVGPKVVDVIRHFGKQKKIIYAHFRNVRGVFPKYDEVFVDNGDVNMLDAMRAYKEAGFDGVMRPDHTPVLATDEQSGSMYSGKHHGRAFAIGYMRALIQAVTQLG